MLDKIEVGKKYRLIPTGVAVTVKFVGSSYVIYEFDDCGTETHNLIHNFKEAYEPLPSPESPVDDVIWECEDEDKWRFKVHRDGVITWGRPPGYSFIPEEGATWVELLAKAYADLYARLNPPLPPLPDGEWERVEVKNIDDVDSGDYILGFGDCWREYDRNMTAHQDGLSIGFAIGRGWVMRRKTTTVEEWPKIGDCYWVVSPIEALWATNETWNGDSYDLLWKERGLIFKTEEEAVAKAKKMVEGVGK